MNKIEPYCIDRTPDLLVCLKAIFTSERDIQWKINDAAYEICQVIKATPQDNGRFPDGISRITERI